MERKDLGKLMRVITSQWVTTVLFLVFFSLVIVLASQFLSDMGTMGVSLFMVFVFLGAIIAFRLLKNRVGLYEWGMEVTDFPSVKIIGYNEIAYLDWMRRGRYARCRVIGKNGKTLASLSSLSLRGMRAVMEDLEQKTKLPRGV